MAVSAIPDDLNPAFLDDVLAKSAEMGGDTLAQHTWAVVSRLADQYRLRPELAKQLGDGRLWHRLYWGCFLHDFGKAALGFQERLRQPKITNTWSEGRQRHEILSLAFANAAFPPGDPDRLPVIAVIIAHHKDFDGERDDTILRKYGGRKPDPQQETRVQFLIDQLNPELIGRLWRWFNEYGEPWSQALGFDQSDVFSVAAIERPLTAENIHSALRDFSAYNLRRKDGDVNLSEIVRDIHYRGLILTADHAASAGTPPFPPMRLTMEIARKPLDKNQRAPNPHQLDAASSAEGSTILTAPTGSGKTEAALMWAARQLELRLASRLFYTLPYQASMNAMADRLCDAFFGIELTDLDRNQDVAIQHSRATLKFYQDAMESDSGAGTARAAGYQAKEIQNKARLNYYPVQVFSPYQMLKAAYRLKGYETLLVDYTNALFIFDEIHAYEPARLALIITAIGWLYQHYAARFLIMTATLPPMVRRALRDTLPGCGEIFAADETFEKSRRHEVHLLEGDVLTNLDLPLKDWQSGQSVLVCCNTVSRAQQAYVDLKERIEKLGHDPREHILLLHGRFNGKDRGDKERRLAEHVGVGAANRRPTIIVATQVVEVSLNIDLDMIYTDPAPLEALLQRFGRVNRGRDEQILCPVYVFREPLGEKESRPYDFKIVQASLEVLEAYCADKPIDEALVTQMLEEMYQGEIEAEWQKKFHHHCGLFQQILDGMIPFTSASWELEKKFYDLFDGWQVLPTDCYDKYEQSVMRYDFLGASQYLVNISSKQFGMLSGKGLLLAQEEGQYFRQTTVPYNPEFGLDLNHRLGKDEDV